MDLSTVATGVAVFGTGSAAIFAGLWRSAESEKDELEGKLERFQGRLGESDARLHCEVGETEKWYELYHEKRELSEGLEQELDFARDCINHNANVVFLLASEVDQWKGRFQGAVVGVNNIAKDRNFWKNNYEKHMSIAESAIKYWQDEHDKLIQDIKTMAYASKVMEGGYEDMLTEKDCDARQKWCDFQNLLTDYSRLDDQNRAYDATVKQQEQAITGLQEQLKEQDTEIGKLDDQITKLEKKIKRLEKNKA